MNAGIRGLLAGTALLAAGTNVAQASVIANFDGGNSTTAVDGYVGASAGTGSGSWTSAWVRLNAGTTATITSDSVVTGNSPTTGGGNYLTADVHGVGATAGSAAFIGRAFDNTATGVSTTTAFNVAFDFRADALPGTGQYLQFYGNPGTGGAGGANTWAIRATATGGFQFLTNPTGTGVATDSLSGLTFAAGTNYHVLVNVLDPSTRQYQVTISNGTTTKTSNIEYFRTTALDGGNSVEFGSFVAAGASDTPFNIDSVAITSTPEPTSLAAAAGAGLLALRRRRQVR